MNIKASFDCGARLIKAVPKVKFNPNSIGYVHPDGQISFATQEAAINYARNRVVKALNCDKPFERGIVINDNAIIAEVDGSAHSVLMPRKYAEGENLVTVHGHPDAVIIEEGHHPYFFSELLFGTVFKNITNRKIKKNGIAYPTSLPDYRSFMLNPKEKKSIVYNSKGEYSILTKRLSGMSMNEQQFLEIRNKYYATVPVINGFFSILKYILRTIRHGFQSPAKVEKSMITEANNLSNKIHEFLTLNTERYGVTYETNYSNLIKK